MTKIIIALFLAIAALSPASAQQTSKYQIQLFDFATGKTIGKAIDSTHPYTFHAGDVFMFNPRQGAPIRRVSHLVARNETVTVFTTMVFVEKPDANFKANAEWPAVANLSDNPVPWPW